MAKNKVRINAELPPGIAQQLVDLTKRRGTSLSEVIRQAIATESYMQDRVDEGAKILIERNGVFKEIVFAR